MSASNPFIPHAVRYDEWFVRNPAAYQAELAAIRGVLPTAEKGVEIGLGTGRFGGPFGIEIGIEPSKGMCDIARQRGITVVRAVAGHLPLPDSSFDYALMVTVICFLDDIVAAFRKCAGCSGKTARLLSHLLIRTAWWEKNMRSASG